MSWLNGRANARRGMACALVVLACGAGAASATAGSAAAAATPPVSSGTQAGESGGTAETPGAPLAGCAAVPSLRAEQALDLGEVRIQRGKDGYLLVSPRGEVVNAVSVMVRRAPMPALLSLCGGANQEVAILVRQPSLRLAMPGGAPVAREVRDIRVEGDGMLLQKVEEGRWEGRLGPAGRATIRVGAAVYFSATGTHGTAGADIEIDVVAR